MELACSSSTWSERAFPQVGFVRCPLTILQRHSELQHHQAQSPILVASCLLARFLRARPQGVVSPLECALGLLPVVVEVLVVNSSSNMDCGTNGTSTGVIFHHAHGSASNRGNCRNTNRALHRLNRASGHPLLLLQCPNTMATVYQCLQYTMPIHRGIFGATQKFGAYSTPPFLLQLEVMRLVYPTLLPLCCSYIYIYIYAPSGIMWISFQEPLQIILNVGVGAVCSAHSSPKFTISNPQRNYAIGNLWVYTHHHC